jgi:ornithine carbamoyltransferase
MSKHFISLNDFSRKDILGLLTLTAALKKNRALNNRALENKTVGLIFQKPSNRTRVSFEVGIHQLGGHCLYLGPEEIHLGKREATSDVAKTLSRYLNAIVARTFSHQDILDLAEYGSIPVINGLSDLYHPCQAVADVFSVMEKFGKCDNSLTLAYIGDGNNVCHSLMIACQKVGLNMNIAAPKGYEPDKKITATTKTSIFIDPQKAVKGAHIIYADVWTSMGQETEEKKRLKDFSGYQINEKLVRLADKDYIFMHCLPAHRGQEVTSGIIDGPHSIVFDQAENRLHAQKAVLLQLLGEQK